MATKATIKFLDGGMSDEMRIWLSGALGNVTAADPDTGNLPLHTAAEMGNPEIVTRLIWAGAYVDARGMGHKTPLHVAIEHDNVEVARRLLLERACVDALDRFARTPLCYARSVEAVDVLVTNGANPRMCDRYGATTLHHAATKSPEVVDALLTYCKLAVDAVDEHGRTALHYAANAAIADVLVNKIGANTTIADRCNELPAVVVACQC
jgi:ankyrin repeat protein